MQKQHNIQWTSNWLNTEKLIEEVRMRPILWDPCADGYRDSTRSKEAWMSIAAAMSPDVLNKKREEELSKEMQKKWRNVRDSFLRSERTREGVGLRDKVKYRYASHLHFLKSFVSASPRQYKNRANSIEDYEEEYPDTDMLKIEEESVSSNGAAEMTEQNEESRDNSMVPGECFNYQTRNVPVHSESFDEDLCFFQSLLPTVRHLSVHNKMSFRISVMSLLQEQLREQISPPYLGES